MCNEVAAIIIPPKTDEEIIKLKEDIKVKELEISKLNKGKILDLGCGSGNTLEVYEGEGFEAIGIDILNGMLEKAKERGINVKKSDMRDIKMFKDKEFDAVFSVSALQWIKNNKDIKKIAENVFRILKDNGKLVIQFYP